MEGEVTTACATTQARQTEPIVCPDGKLKDARKIDERGRHRRPVPAEKSLSDHAEKSTARDHYRRVDRLGGAAVPPQDRDHDDETDGHRAGVPEERDDAHHLGQDGVAELMDGGRHGGIEAQYHRRVGEVLGELPEARRRAAAATIAPASSGR